MHLIPLSISGIRVFTRFTVKRNQQPLCIVSSSLQSDNTKGKSHQGALPEPSSGQSERERVTHDVLSSKPQGDSCSSHGLGNSLSLGTKAKKRRQKQALQGTSIGSDELN